MERDDDVDPPPLFDEETETALANFRTISLRELEDLFQMELQRRRPQLIGEIVIPIGENASVSNFIENRFSEDDIILGNLDHFGQD